MDAISARMATSREIIATPVSHARCFRTVNRARILLGAVPVLRDTIMRTPRGLTREAVSRVTIPGFRWDTAPILARGREKIESTLGCNTGKCDLSIRIIRD